MRPAITLATLSGVLVIAQLIVSKAARDTLFLTSYPVTALPTAMVISALVTLPAVLGSSALMARVGPHRFLSAFLLFNALLFAAAWAVLPILPRVAVGCLYVQVALFGGLSVSGFWSVINECFDPHAAKRAFTKVGTGFALGGLLGGILAERTATWFGVRSMLLVLVPTNVLVAIAVVALGSGQQHVPAAGPPVSGLQTLARSGYLRGLAILVVMAAISASTLDYTFKSSVAAHLGQPERLAKFFAAYYMVTSVATIVLQATASRFSLQHFGIGVTLAVLPIALLFGGAISMLFGGVWSISMLRGTEAVFATAFFRSAYEPLYTPLPPEKKRATKSIIDVAADRLGDAVGSAGVLLVLALAPSLSWHIAIVIAMLAAAVSLWISPRLQRGYVAELAISLRKGVIRVSEHEVADATTRLTLSQTHSEMNREMLLRAVAAAVKTHSADPDIAKSVAELVSGDPSRIQRELEARPLHRRLVSLVIPLLEHNDVRDAAMQAIESVAAESIGQLNDALLDVELANAVRYRIPSILAKVANPRSVRALVQGLADPDFALRERCTQGLLTLRRQDPTLRPPQALVLSAIRTELEVSANIWQSRGAAIKLWDSTLSQIEVVSGNRSLQHVFTLLGLIQDPDELELALRALGSGDAKMHGTALEYLDNVIPNDIKTALWPHVATHRPIPRHSARSNRELTDELKRSFSG